MKPMDNGGWVPVAERLPEYEEEVLICVNGKVEKARVRETYSSDTPLAFYAGSDWVTWILAEVTHWMPSPKPPKAKE